MKKRYLTVLMVIFFTNVWADNVEQGVEKYDWQTCITSKSNECINGCADSESIDCANNCRDLAADKCISEGVAKP